MDLLDSLEGFLLTAIVALPAATAAAMVVLTLALQIVGAPRLPNSAWRGLSVASTVLVFAASVYLVIEVFDVEQLGLQVVESISWSPALGATLSFGIDGISLCFLLSTTALVPLALLSAREEEAADDVMARILVTLTLESALLGSLVATNLLVFIFFWAATFVPILLWLGRWGGVGSARAASRIWATESIGLAGLLLAMFILHEMSFSQLGAPTLDLISPISGNDPRTLLDVRLEVEEQWTIFFAFALALATRLPIVPMHFWLPAAHAAAPAGLSIFLATGFIQTAAMGWMRFALPLAPDAAEAAGPALSVLGIFALGYASLIALVQKELNRLLAYSSVGYAGFSLFGMSTLNVQGLTGSVLQLLTHGLATAGLFLLTGFLAQRRGTTEVAAFGGLAKPMPVCAFFFGVMVLSLMGLPVLGGFVGDLFVLLGSLETRRTLSVFALLAMVVAASYLLWVQRRLFLGPVDEPANRGLIDLDRLERGILLAITLPIIAIGVYPNPVLRRVEPAVLELLYQMERRSVVSEESPERGAPGESEVPSGVARRSRGAAGATLAVARIGEGR